MLFVPFVQPSVKTTVLLFSWEILGARPFLDQYVNERVKSSCCMHLVYPYRKVVC